MKKKKLYIVKREVRAYNLAEAVLAKGVIYEVTIADDRYQPEEYVDGRMGFRKKQKNES